MPGRLLLAVALGAALATSAVPAYAAPGTAAPATAAPVPVLDWTDCGGGFECATAVVPLDHARPRGDTIELALVRSPAADPAHKLGTLFANPGGPGGSGIEFVRTAPPGALAVVNANFDFVGWDPRGVGASSRVDCGDVDYFPAGLPRAGRFAEDDWVRASRRYGRDCLAGTGPLLGHVSTADTARDLDLLRQAVGDDKLSYMGISYGTLIGATYAALFPGRTRAMVLDAAIDPDVWTRRPLEARHEQVNSFERSLGRFFTACAADQVACSGFGGTDPEAAFDALVARLDAHPLPAGGGRVLDGDRLLDVAADIVYDKGFWAPFAAGLAAAEAGDGSVLGGSGDIFGSISGAAGNAIRGLDQDYPRAPRPVLDAGRFAAGMFPHFGWLDGAIQLTESMLPVEAPQAFRGPFRNLGAAPILVIGGTHDPATPYVWSQRLVAQLGNARLLTYAADGHGALQALDGCVLGATFGYLERGVLPAAGAVCRQQTPFGGASVRTAAPRWETGERLH